MTNVLNAKWNIREKITTRESRLQLKVTEVYLELHKLEGNNRKPSSFSLPGD